MIQKLILSRLNIINIVVTAHGIDENRWSHFLAPQLTGKAQ